MKVVETKRELRALLDAERASGRTVGFFPTMGSLHAGHEDGIARASRENDVGVTSIFVNPTQFGPNEDLANYPRTLEADLVVCERAGASYVFAPTVEEMYTDDTISIDVGPIGQVLCGVTRPWHFNGVATVVAKLWNIVGPCRSYFGEKDYQQLTVLRRLASAFDVPVEIIGTPIVREPDGLAMSSRNVYLAPEERRAALCLKAALDAGAEAVRTGERDGARVAATMARTVESEGLARLDYAACVDPVTLQDLERIEGDARLAVAAWVGPARLIDNSAVTA
jgi:pantoate--beta-alanine ligase